MSSKNTIQLALQTVNQINKGQDPEFGKKYRTRARQTPSILHSVGLLGTISYLFAKAGNEYQNLFSAGTDEKLSTEEASYALYLKHIMDFLQLNAGLQASDINSVIKALGNDANLLIYCESILEPYIGELKNFSDALLETE